MKGGHIDAHYMFRFDQGEGDTLRELAQDILNLQRDNAFGLGENEIELLENLIDGLTPR